MYFINNDVSKTTNVDNKIIITLQFLIKKNYYKTNKKKHECKQIF